MSREYKLNSEMEWTFWRDEQTQPPVGVAIWMLCEEDTCDPTQPPSVFKVIIEEYNDPQGFSNRARRTGKGWRFKLLDFDPEEEDEYLSPNMWTFVAWREMTDHAGTWDRFLAEETNE